MPRKVVLHHIMPASKDGSDTDESKQLPCQSCNSMKGNCLTTTELKAKPARLKICK